MRRIPFALALGALLTSFGSCGVDAESNTGMLVVVTLDESAVVDGQPPPLDMLRFYVATRKPDTDLWILNEALRGRPIDVAGRDLRSEPYRLFLAENGDGKMETIRIVVVGEKGAERVLFGTLGQPPEQTLERFQILERTIALRPSSDDMGLTWTATGCLLSADGTIRFGSAADRDCDGYLSEEHGGEDCDDDDPRVNPAADDSHDCDQVDNDCDGVIDPGGDLDADGDGVTACHGDCDDGDPDVYPGAQEDCDGVDNNCNGKCDEGHDADGDGYTPCGTLLADEGKVCVVVPAGDCNDQDAGVHPGAEETCNGKDDNCNGVCDEGTDLDLDGFNECGSVPGATVTTGNFCIDTSPELIDCAPEDPAVHPGAPEVCDGLNNDCNSATSPPQTVCYETEGSVDTGRCLEGISACSEGGGSGVWGECVYNVETATQESPTMCGAWTLCSSSPDPAACIEASVESFQLGCQVHVTTQEMAPCFEDPPTYYLPFGVSALDGCAWTLQLDYNTTGWQMVGLVDPYHPMSPNQRLNSCEAALVAKPYYSAGGVTPEPLRGKISLVHLDGLQSVLIIIGFEIGVNFDCAAGSSLTCTLGSAP